MAAKSSNRHQKVDIADSVLQLIEDHAYSETVKEVGGILVGKITGKTTEIVAAIPALSAVGEQISLTFTHVVWDEVLSKVDNDYPEFKIVGWYHTHPNHGLFLSQYDVFIQENFFASKGMVALVIDPVQGELAWFEQNAKKDIIKFDESPTERGPIKAHNAPVMIQQSGLKAGKVAIISVVVALLSGIAGWSLNGLSTPPDRASALKEAKNRYLAAESQLGVYQQIMAQPVLVYTIKENDSFESIATSFYGDPTKASMIAVVNQLDPSAALTPGWQILLPNVPGISVSPQPSSIFVEPPKEQSVPEPSEGLPSESEEAKEDQGAV